MDVEIVTGGASPGDDLRSLRDWLLDEPEFSGRVTLRDAAPHQDVMGLDVATLVLALAGGGGGAVLAATAVRTLGNVIITWMKTRAPTSPVDVTVRRADGAEVTFTAAEVGGLSAAGVARLLDDLANRLGPPPGAAGGDGSGNISGGGGTISGGGGTAARRSGASGPGSPSAD